MAVLFHNNLCRVIPAAYDGSKGERRAVREE